jgi:hypothetical protein
MAAIRKDHFKGVMGSDKQPDLTTILRDIADDLGAIKTALVALSPVTTANGTDLTTTEALANAIKTDLNAFTTAIAAVTLKHTKA